MGITFIGLRTFRAACVVVAAFLATAVPVPALAAPGDVDLSFGTQGLSGAFTTGLPLVVQQVAWQGDKVLVASTPRRVDLAPGERQGPYEYRIVLTRFKADGTPDTGFGTGGEVMLKNAVSYDGMPPGTSVRIAWQEAGDFRAIHVVSEVGYYGALAHWTVSENGESVSRQVHLAFDPPAPFDGFLGQSTVGAIAALADGRVVVAGTVRVDDSDRFYVREVGGYSWSSLLVPGLNALEATGLAWDESTSTFYLAGTLSDPLVFGSAGAVVVAIDDALAGVDATKLGTGIRSWPAPRASAGIVALNGVLRIGFATQDPGGPAIGFDQMADDGTPVAGYGNGGTRLLVDGSASSLTPAGIALSNSGAVMALRRDQTLAYWRTSEDGDDLGITTPIFPGALTGAASAIASDGDQVVVAGSVDHGSGVRRNAFTAFDGNGVLLTGFGGGLVQAPGSTRDAPSSQAMVRLSTGRIVTGAIVCETQETWPHTQPMCSLDLAGYQSDGTIDATFGAGGVATRVFALDENPYGLRMVADTLDRIVVAYDLWYPDAGAPGGGWTDVELLRFGAAGAVDGSFGGGADRMVFANGAGEYETLRGLAVDSAQRPLVLIGYQSAGHMRSSVARRLATGGADGSFAGPSGVFVTSGIDGSDDVGLSIAVAPGDKPVVAGYLTPSSEPLVYRLTSSGAPDTSFNGSGFRVGLPGWEQGSVGAVAVDGTTTFLAGNEGPAYRTRIGALDDAGVPMPSFAGCGSVALPYAYLYPAGVSVDGDRILVHGTGRLARFARAGTLEQHGFGGAGFAWDMVSSGVDEAVVVYETAGGQWYSAHNERFLNFPGVARDATGGYVVGSRNRVRNSLAGLSAYRVLGGASAAPTVTLTGPTSVVVGGPASYDAAVDGGATGNVRFRFVCPSDGEAVPLAAGSASRAFTFDTPGTYVVSAVYEGSATHGPAIGLLTVTATAGGTATTTLIAADTNPSVFGQTVQFTATVTGGTPSGTVTFKDGAVEIGSVPLSGANAVLNLSTLGPGLHSITANYGGDATHAASSSGALAQTVNPAATMTSIASDANPSKFGQGVTFTATVTPVAPGGGAPEGSVEFKQGAASLGFATLAGGTAAIGMSGLPVGSAAITATYAGSANHLGSTSGGLLQTVDRSSTATTLSTAPASPVYGQAVVLNALSVATPPGAGVPQGNVEFFDFGAGATIQTVAVDLAGAATTPLWVPPPGPASLEARYAGSANHDASIGPLALTVAKGAVTSIGGALPLPVVAGIPTTLRATITKVGSGVDPTGSVEFFEGATSFGSAALGAGGNAQRGATLMSGVHYFDYNYSGDANYAPHSGSFAVDALSPTDLMIAMVQGDLQSTAPGAGFALPLRVKVTTALGAPVAGQAVVFALVPHPLSGASAVLAGGGPTNASGETEVNATANGFAGPHQVTATVGGGTAAVAFRLTNVQTSATLPGGTEIELLGTAPPVTLSQWSETAPPLPLPSNVTSFPFGLVGFRIEGLAPGATVQVKLTFPGSVAAMQYYKYQNGGYFPMPGAVLSGNEITLTLTDGGIGDADGVANRVIVDPGGPAVVAAIGRSQVVPVPALGAPLLALLALMLAVFGAAQRRRR